MDMTIKELISKQGVCTPVELYVDDRLILSADTDNLKELIKYGKIPGDYTVIRFDPVVFTNYSGDGIVFMYVYTRSKK